ncbi:hypothetical protein Vi05172_g5848 [Venturia inaequalis]|nr:hypothetical protein Vi05172_g5848 [Venturia inaequalis]
MIGKLHVWRGDQKKEALAQDRFHVRGSASFDDLDLTWKDALSSKAGGIAPIKKRLSLISRRSFSLLAPSKPGEDGDDDSFFVQSASQDLSLFSNIPAVTNAGRDRPSSFGFPPSPPRSRTADQDHSLHCNRIRSRTAPPVPTPTNKPRVPWADKPLPLAIDFDRARKRSSSISSQQPSIQSIPDEIRSSYGASVSRPKTSSCGDPPYRRKRSGSLTGRLPATTPSYSLTPTITPQHSRGPSINAVQNNRTSRDTLNKSNSTASANGFAPRSRASSSSRMSIRTQITTRANGWRSPVEQTSILDGVEGTLNATITELQDLQSGYNNNDNVSGSSGSVGSDDQAHSIQSIYDSQKRDLHTALAENDALKKQLSLLRTRLANNHTIQIERDQLEEMYRESQANLQESVKHGQTLIDKLRLSRDKEEASRNNISELKHRLEEANMHKLDALHRHHELEDALKLVEKNYKMLQEEREIVEQKSLSFEAEKSVLRLEIAKLPALHQEIAKLRQRPHKSALDEALNKRKAAEERARNLEQQASNDRADLPSIIADLDFKMEDLQRGLIDKDRRIEELEAANRLLTKNAKFDKNCLAEQHKTFRTIQAERDQLRQLIHTEFRRTANEVQKREHPASALLERKVEVDSTIMEVRKRAREFLGSEKRKGDDPAATRASRVKELEQEIDYHVKDIILYKLDVKGYKKDLKRAQTKLARLEGIYSHGNSLVGQYSSKDSSATRRSISSRDSESSVDQAVGGMTHGNDFESTDEEASPSGRKTGRIASVYYSPDGSPLSSPKTETKGFNFVGAGI